MTDNNVVVAEQGEEKRSKKAFIVTPIGGDNTGIRRATDGLIRSVLKPVLEKYGYEAIASHQENDLGSITAKLIKHLLEDELVIVNLSHLNANVMYELGIRHATGKPVILISENETDLPFDTKDQRTIFFSNDMMGGIELTKRLEAIISDQAKLENNEGNPIFMAAHESVLNKAILDKVNSKNVSSEERGLVEMVLSKMEKFEKVVSHSMIVNSKNESGYSGFVNSLVEYTLKSVGGYGIAVNGKDYYVAVENSTLADFVKKDIESHGFFIDSFVSYEKAVVMIVKGKNDPSMGWKLKTVVEESVIPF